MNPTSDPLRQTPFHSLHAGAGARFSPFAGYDMPVFYRGIYDEALAVRTTCGVFDVSHMARLFFPESAQTFLQKLLTCNVANLRRGVGAYALILNEEGGILDDVILFQKPDGGYLLVVNAGNHKKILDWILARGGSPEDATFGTAMVAVQGPDAEKILRNMLHPAGDGPSLRDLRYFSIAAMEWIGIPGAVSLVSRSGYTGEDGFEITFPPSAAGAVWSRLVGANVVPCGLGARDVLRIEAGYSLYGSDMDERSGPADAGLGFAVAAGVDFWGADALKVRPVRRRMTGIDAGEQPSVILRHGYPVLDGEVRVGEITSGVYSKYLKRSIAYASIDALSPDRPVSVDVRGRRVPARCVNRRFVRGRVRSH